MTALTFYKDLHLTKFEWSSIIQVDGDKLTHVVLWTRHRGSRSHNQVACKWKHPPPTKVSQEEQETTKFFGCVDFWLLALWIQNGQFQKLCAQVKKISKICFLPPQNLHNSKKSAEKWMEIQVHPA